MRDKSISYSGSAEQAEDAQHVFQLFNVTVAVASIGGTLYLFTVAHYRLILN